MSARLRGWILAAGALVLAVRALPGPPRLATGTEARGPMRLVPRAGVTPGRPGRTGVADLRISERIL
ncbi:MAG TPA: hypothetical protein DEP35_19435 [Deltaproteobacteria bacterium]|nr:hypothetical protein [Deltaproteobacteria bacterium]